MTKKLAVTDVTSASITPGGIVHKEKVRKVKEVTETVAKAKE